MFRIISLNFTRQPPYNITNSIDLVPNPKSNQMDSTSHPLNTSFPILLISIIGIITTAVMLLSYYIFVIKCCLFRFRRISPPHFNPRADPALGWPGLQPRFNLHRPVESRGLHPSAINSIPTVRFTKSTASSFQCAICIAAFEEREVLRLLPNCAHAFHLDCIDTWLQSNANCPLCRAQISGAFSNVVDVDGGVFSIIAPVAREETRVGRKKKLKMASMDDECVSTVREREERFVVEPIRRSFSMDSSNDPALYLTVQHILRHSDDTRVKRLFSFGRSSRRTSVLPL